MSRQKIVHLGEGHGGHDPGAVGNGLMEKNLTLAIGNEVDTILTAHGVKVTRSRTTDKYVSLKARADLANANEADVKVSLHINSAKNVLAHGVETFNYPNSVNGRKLAKAIQDSLVADKIFNSNRGVKTANFYVLRETNMPTALVELGFISNVNDARILRAKQNEIAVSVAKGILKYLGIRYNGNKPSTPSTPPPPVTKPTSGKFKIGDRVTVKKTASKYATGQDMANFVKGSTYTVSKVEKNRVLLKEITSWVKLTDLVESNTTSPKENLTVDGLWGKDVNRALQRALGTTVDGIISGQYKNSVTSAIYGVSFTTKTGSSLVRALQRKIGAKVDGFLGTETIRLLQRYLGTLVDGKISKPSTMVRELQRRLNAGTF